MRFFTDEQEEIYSVSRPAMMVGFVVVAVLAGCHNWLDGRQQEKAHRHWLRRILG